MHKNCKCGEIPPSGLYNLVFTNFPDTRTDTWTKGQIDNQKYNVQRCRDKKCVIRLLTHFCTKHTCSRSDVSLRWSVRRCILRTTTLTDMLAKSLLWSTATSCQFLDSSQPIKSCRRKSVQSTMFNTHWHIISWHIYVYNYNDIKTKTNHDLLALMHTSATSVHDCYCMPVPLMSLDIPALYKSAYYFFYPR